MKALLLSAYDASSHRYWREILRENLNNIHWTQLILPPRFFNWRIRGNPLSWFAEQYTTLNQPYDFIIATSMVDLATLRGLVPTLTSIPTLVYFHENQFAYPDSPQQPKPSIDAQITSLYSALAADHIAFNSIYNQQTFLTGGQQLLQKMPDHAPLEIISQLEKKSSILPVPIASAFFQQRPKNNTEPLTLVWNHRWEFDKAPERLYLTLKKLEKSTIKFRLHLLGERFRKSPLIFEKIQTEFAGSLGIIDYIEDLSHYQNVLANADIVISTSLHEFQGLSILNAVASGCMPAVPDRLSYCELFDKHFRYASYPDNPEKEAAALCRLLLTLAQKKQQSLKPNLNLTELAWPKMRPKYQSCFKQLIVHHAQN
jgi:glycosyltransferase involved in cell wall biosynthesis